MSAILRPLEMAYRGATRARRALHRAGVLNARRLPRPVVSIGNLSFGGSGKTPAAIATARLLQQKGLRVAILTRGHGRRDVRAIDLVAGDDADRFGDEPVLLAMKLSGAAVVVGADRFAAGTWYLGAHDCDVFLLDDGFQHLRLERDVDIVIVSDAPSPWREGSSALADADIVLRRGAVSFPLPDRPVFDATLEPVAFRWRGARAGLDALRGKRAFAFAGLADNRQFFAMLERLGVVIAGRSEFRDHHRYTLGDISALRAQARSQGADLLVTTEKDAVKVRDDEIAVLEVELAIAPGYDAALLQRIPR